MACAHTGAATPTGARAEPTLSGAVTPLALSSAADPRLRVAAKTRGPTVHAAAQPRDARPADHGQAQSAHVHCALPGGGQGRRCHLNPPTSTSVKPQLLLCLTNIADRSSWLLQQGEKVDRNVLRGCRRRCSTRRSSHLRQLLWVLHPAGHLQGRRRAASVLGAPRVCVGWWGAHRPGDLVGVVRVLSKA